MDIPAKFKLFGSEYDIKINNNLLAELGIDGRHASHTKTILLRTFGDGYHYNPSYIEQTYFHEIIHAILCVCGYDELNKDEKFIECFANALHQVLTTGTGKVQY